MANKSKLHKKKKKKLIPSRKSGGMQISFGDKRHPFSESLSYTITEEPIRDDYVPEEVQNEMENLFYKSQDEPELVIDRLEELIEKYPNMPLLYNFISVAYSTIGNLDKAKHYVFLNYKNNPDYLFSKLNYAEICMKNGDYDQVPEIFDNKFDLKALYPERDVFHLTEVVSFMGIVGTYFAHIGATDQVELFYRCLNELVPNHKLTRMLGDHFYANSLKDEFNRMIGKY